VADDSTRTPGSGESIRSVDKTGVKTQVFLLDVGNTGTEKLLGSAVGIHEGTCGPF
jgi:hypothetical protein